MNFPPAASNSCMNPLRHILLTLSASVILLADAYNMSGTWALNVKRSTWGQKPAPVRVDLTIQHNEPSLKYSGSVQPAGEQTPSKFSFDGAIDGKEYTVKDDTGSYKVRLTRKSDSVVEAVTIGHDGKTHETSTVTMQRDGKTMIRKLKAKLPDGRTSEWTEIYEKQH